MGPLLLPFAGGLSSRVSWRVFVRPVIADDGLHRAYGERGAFLTADGERDGAQNHAILRGTKTTSIRAFAGRAAAPPSPAPLEQRFIGDRQVATDHAAGYLMAFGAIAALARRCTEGGSWHVRVSLAQTGKWLRQLGRIERGLSCHETSFDGVQDLLEVHDSGFGRLAAIRHAAQLSETPARWARPSMPLGAHLAAWPE